MERIERPEREWRLPLYSPAFPLLMQAQQQGMRWLIPLESRYRIPHGVANGVLLPYVMELNMQSSPARLAEIARAAGKDIDGMGQAELQGRR